MIITLSCLCAATANTVALTSTKSPFSLLSPLSEDETKDVVQFGHTPLHVAVSRAQRSPSSLFGLDPLLPDGHDHWEDDVDSPHVQCRRRLSSVDLLQHLTILDNITRVLEDPRTDTDIADCTGRTALMHAAYDGWDDAFALMVDHGVNCAWTSSRDGKTVHEQAKANYEQANANWDANSDEPPFELLFVYCRYDQILGKLYEVRLDARMRTTAVQALVQWCPAQHTECLSALAAELSMSFVPKSWWKHLCPYEYYGYTSSTAHVLSFM